MISTQSKLKSNSKFFSSFLLSIKSSKKILIFISVLHALGLPMLASLLVFSSKYYFSEYYDTISALLLISAFCLLAAVLCGIFIAVDNFSYLYKKSEVDMIYSLPIKRKTKFLSDYLSGLAVYLVPCIIACLIANIILLLGPDNINMALILQGEFAGLLCMLMLYTLTVLVLCCCSTLFESIISILLINFIIPASIIIAAVLFFTGLYGVSVINTVLSALGYSSPLGAAINFLLILADSGVIDNINGATYCKWVLLFLLFTAAYFLISMFLYKKRKAEDTSKPYVFKFMYYIFITVITMGISILARIETELMIPVILFAFIVYMIFEVITNRGFRKIYRSIIKYAVTMLGILIACTLASVTHGFGVESKTYSPSLISSVDVTYKGIDSYLTGNYDITSGYQHWSDEYFDSYNTVRYKDKEIIKLINNIQKQALDIYKSGKYNYYIHFDFDSNVYYYIDENDNTDKLNFPMYEIGIRFNLKTGGSTIRYYKLNFEQMKMLSVLDSTEEFADKIKEGILYDYPDELYNYTTGSKNKKYILSYTRLLNAYGEANEMTLTADEAEEFKKCFKQDYMEATYKDFTTSEVLCYLNYNIPLRKCFERTVSFIKNKGGLDLYASPYYMSNEEGILYSPEGYTSWGRNDVTASFGVSETINGYSRQLNSSQTTELIRYARGCYMEEAESYVLYVNNSYYVIPYKYTNIAEKIYNESSNNKSDYAFEEYENQFPQISDPEPDFYNRVNTNSTLYD